MVTARPSFRNRELSACSVIPDQVDFTTAGTVVEDDLALTRLTFRNCLGESIHAIAILPAEPAGTMPGVICTNGTTRHAVPCLARSSSVPSHFPKCLHFDRMTCRPIFAATIGPADTFAPAYSGIRSAMRLEGAVWYPSSISSGHSIARRLTAARR